MLDIAGTRPRISGVRGHELLRRTARRVLGPKFVKHYVNPKRIRGRQVPYDAKRFFESWHRASPASLSDADTIAAERGSLASRFHYNAVENSIIECLAGRALPRPLRVLDVGSGAGHWVDFYFEVFGADEAVGIEISEPAVQALEERYADVPAVTIVEADVGDAGFDLDGEFEIVNAIGVMFHIVDDDRWERAVAALGRRLGPGGALVVGGQFGHVTQNVQFHRTDSFSSWEDFRSAAGETALVNKRIRSLRRWRRCAARAGLQIACVRRTRQSGSLHTPENNVLVLEKEAERSARFSGLPRRSARDGVFRTTE
jgi:SAM-dependent methyltransferase